MFCCFIQYSKNLLYLQNTVVRTYARRFVWFCLYTFCLTNFIIWSTMYINGFSLNVFIFCAHTYAFTHIRPAYTTNIWHSARFWALFVDARGRCAKLHTHIQVNYADKWTKLTGVGVERAHSCANFVLVRCPRGSHSARTKPTQHRNLYISLILSFNCSFRLRRRYCWLLRVSVSFNSFYVRTLWVYL